MHAVHFGAGNIGRGFIGALLYQAGYHTTFVDVNDSIIRALNSEEQYDVVLAAEESETLTVKNVSGINSISNPDAVMQAIVQADIVTTAVGPNILPVISELIAKGLRERLKSNKQSLNLIACENMVGSSTTLKENVYKYLADDEQAACADMFGFPDAAVDRIVPNQTDEDILQVSVEPYYEWVVEQTAIKGDRPPISGITYVNDLKPYIERKLFTVNTGHAAAAYVGRDMGYTAIHEAVRDDNVQAIMQGALQESGEVLIQTYGFDREEHQQYIDKIIERFMNPYISDEVTRVGRGPIRKLGPNDRLIRPATLYMDLTGEAPKYLAKTIAAALNYHTNGDEEAVKLQAMIAEQGYIRTLQIVADLEADDPLIDIIMQELE
ncbi:D-mannitol 1-phosphate 5-dehydrogenase [Lentibacillus halodurans]|uniref:Mannitol-1-phosphate 5-dehydrogenase n=1 Tax=Lentibacillus halodurans TaxID=237679 RepID=A0A1I0XKA9_9BACI|nr:mannitol-1-phosphate 5-dehydrogenase [Lentibacillus halodurans]SFB00750.1 D-mannitol 1-phosphate 5-dehydrogenase [Lentibacillus halodurans]